MSTSLRWLCLCLLLTAFAFVMVSPASDGYPVVINGIVGESATLPSGLDTVQPKSIKQWLKNKELAIQHINEKTQVILKEIKGRVSVDEKWCVTIKSLRKSDSADYMCTENGAPVQTVTLNVYDGIGPVSVISHLSSITDNRTCNITLSCSVSTGSQVNISWSRDGEKIPEMVNRRNISVADRHGVYTCNVSNPVTSQTGQTTVLSCRTQTQSDPDRLAPDGNIPVTAVGAGAGLGLLLLILIIMWKCYTRQKNDDLDGVNTIYAEIEETQKMDMANSKSPACDTANLYDTIQDPVTQETPGIHTLYDKVDLKRDKDFTQNKNIP